MNFSSPWPPLFPDPRVLATLLQRGGLWSMLALFALSPLFELGAFLIAVAVLIHILLIALLGRLPRMAGALLIAAYGVFLWKNFA